MCAYGIYYWCAVIERRFYKLDGFTVSVFFNLAEIPLRWTVLIGEKEESRRFHKIIQDASTIHLYQRIPGGGQIDHRQRAGVCLA